MLPVLYNNNYQIVQTPDHVMILVEMVQRRPHHPCELDARSSNVRQWLGDSIGHWEGDTLVVDTTNFTDQTRFRGASENLHVIERFTRVDPNTVLYRVYDRRTLAPSQKFGPRNIRSWRRRVRFMNTPAMKATIR